MDTVLSHRRQWTKRQFYRELFSEVVTWSWNSKLAICLFNLSSFRIFRFGRCAAFYSSLGPIVSMHLHHTVDSRHDLLPQTPVALLYRHLEERIHLHFLSFGNFLRLLHHFPSLIAMLDSAQTSS